MTVLNTMEKSEGITHLPRGGIVVESSVGPIQFGLPPESIKDHMSLKREVPTHFVIPADPFVRQIGPSQGLNVGEFEFPTYFNFFLKKRRVNLIVDSAEAEERIRKVFQETLLGPSSVDSDQDYEESFPREKRADLMKEMGYFRTFGSTKLNVDLLMRFTRFDESGVATVREDDGGTGGKGGEAEESDGNDGVALAGGAGGSGGVRTAPVVRITKHGSTYRVTQDDEVLAEVADEVELPRPTVEALGSEVFKPPLFGVTVLGASHGFDPTGSTSGYVLWVNQRGIMIDPPPNSSQLLQHNHIPPSLIEAVIVTHCHADHDAGTFQKILTEGRITLLTTKTIMGSFLRKYSALSGLDPDFLQRIFAFRPVRVGAAMKMRGAVFRFFYSLHSIPCMGFTCEFGGKSIVFSADHLNDPARIKALHREGVLSDGRRDELLNFPWHSDLILHEAGVPPIHTPMSTLAGLPDEVKAKLHVVHVGLRDIPEGSGLRRAAVGVENTLVLDVEAPVDADLMEALDLVSNIDLLSSLSLRHAREILQLTTRERFAAGSYIVRKGDKGDTFHIIANGVAEVRVGFRRDKSSRTSPVMAVQSPHSVATGGAGGADSAGRPSSPGAIESSPSNSMLVKHYTVGDYFGEQALITEGVRSVDIVAQSDVELVTVRRDDFQWLLQGTDVVSRMRHLIEMRKNRAWEVFAANSMLSHLSASQKTQLEEYVHRRVYLEGEYIWRAHEVATCALLVDEGSVRFDRVIRPRATTRAGSASGGPASVSISSPKRARHVAPEELGPGAFVGDVDALLHEDEQRVGLLAASRCVVLELEREDLMRFFSRNPGVLLALMHSYYVV